MTNAAAELNKALATRLTAWDLAMAAAEREIGALEVAGGGVMTTRTFVDVFTTGAHVAATVTLAAAEGHEADPAVVARVETAKKRLDGLTKRLRVIPTRPPAPADKP